MNENFGLNESNDNFEEVVFGNLLRAADSLRRRTEIFLKEGGITLLQYNVLRTVREFSKDGAPTQKVAEFMLNEVPDITRLIDRLVIKKLVIRKRGKEDRRVVRVFLTEKGLSIANKFEKPLVEFHKKNLNGVCSRKELKSLNRLLYLIRQK